MAGSVKSKCLDPQSISECWERRPNFENVSSFMHVSEVPVRYGSASEPSAWEEIPASAYLELNLMVEGAEMLQAQVRDCSRRG